MGRLLDQLGPGYRYRTIEFDALLDSKRLAENDVLFLTCGGVPPEWLGRKLDESRREGGGVFEARPEVTAKVRASLRGYVHGGGTLYASDYRFQLLKIAFPEFIDSAKEERGAVQTVAARVTDPDLAKRVGDTIELRFDKPAWYPAAFRGPDVTTYLTGAYQTIDGRQTSGPLLATFPFGEGTVVFTSFHNEAQNSRIEMELLHYLALASVTAKADAAVRQELRRGEFSPEVRNLLSVSQKAEPIVETYECRKAGPLRFVLAFDDRGAKLELEIAGPDGLTADKTGTKTFTVDVAKAVPGTYRCTITPIDVPYENFPFTLTVAGK